ncbi:microtubule-associated tumor suppressor 1 homolog A isoform X1 [Hippoglossus hippoglossus]|uniref:microtubule-associated tumor suppressor 1 homolog A isoform X1 n=1 Tax=Hippoglossus hippoglossus TaxID=8267 RepID=UPI00148D150D|nr:microtubule-associated tumor suppressor 1 homolog A isoform X1 [Hippoglossus hippoglossus]XP_034453136.1 microtubule-associated tumor suppressor 1 homolog A isoform X1 [Hippoglossus hippoglossus]XP_034453137.1 microtubule-associated tumor suppressor 1 homolog A isoform X1 [Hippoglossus hippoglossus]XP_034453139.1 microtubule-associated tumor suppressor 1 homolog A isoform X1 [Hippoglossus hippoglossus]XP_034453140.1 microtubule-associated tumor suppressor 1 homolog A isoform X1 [Hippoglossus
MSNKTFTMSTDQVKSTVPVPHRGMQLGLSPKSHYSNSSMSPSPDSESSISNMSDREAGSSPDINMLECCLSEGSFVDNLDNNTLQQDVFCDVSTNLNQTFIATPVNDSMNFWNKNSNGMSSQETELEYHTLSMNTEDDINTEMTSPDSAARESHLSSCEISRRGSTENDWHSLSSCEMVMRRNSFGLEDQSLLIVSSLDGSSISPADGHAAFPTESNLLSTTLPDVCEKSTEMVMGENAGHPCLGVTFTQADNWELPAEENDIATCNALVALPSEDEGCLFMTFVCEPSSADSGKEVHFSSVEADLLAHFPGASTPEQGNTFVSTLSALQENYKDIKMSTPVQNIEDKTPRLPSFSESPCTENAISPGLQPVKQPTVSVTQKQRLVAGLSPSSSKVNKLVIKKFPKSDFGFVKFKVVTRAVHQMVVPGPASQHKPSQVNVTNKRTESHTAATVRISPAKIRNSTAVISTTTKTVSDTQKRVNTGAASLGVKTIQSCGHNAVDGQDKSRASPLDHRTAANKHASVIQSSNGSSETEQATSCQGADTSAKHTGNQTFCFSSLEKSPDQSGKTDPKPAPKKGMSNKIQVRSGSALGQGKPLFQKTRPRCSSEGSSSATRPPKEKRTILRVSTSFTIPKADKHLGQTNPGNLTCSSQKKRDVQAEATKRTAESATRSLKKISLVAESSTSTSAGVSGDESKGRFQLRPSPRQTRAAPPAICPRAVTLSTRQRQATLTPQSRQTGIAGNPRGDPSLGTTSAPSVKSKLNGSQPPQTPTRLFHMGPPTTPASRLPRKTPEPSRSFTEANNHGDLGEGAGSTKVPGGAAYKQTPFKSVVLKARLFSTPGKNTGLTLTTACKPAASTSKAASNYTVSPLKRTASARLVRLPSGGAVDKSKPKATSRQQHPQQKPSQPSRSHGPPDVVPPSVAKGERKDQSTQQLRGHLAASNCRFEALTIVLQQTLTERDEATKQCRELSQELVNLRGDLVCSIHSSECLEREKEALRLSLDDAVQKLQEQHQRDAAELEQKLQAFYQAEWDKVHITYQEEADKCKTLMQQQMGELKANHEAMKLEVQSSHAEQLQCVKQQYEISLEEHRNVHIQELQSLDKSLKDAESSLSRQIQELTMEKNGLIEKLTAEEKKRRALAERSLKDSHTLYLEQELESLKVVLDIKNKQLHQQEKKLMEIDKLMEKNVKLDENLKKVQQENEDFRARMERHAALSRQLSTEQTMLQETLQKESKVNKRLSMENEELMWKLHNGDLSSPRKVSPTSTSPSPSFSLQSPRSSAFFSSPPVSPR